MYALFNVVDGHGKIVVASVIYEEAKPELDRDKTLNLAPIGSISAESAGIRRLFAECGWRFGRSIQECIAMRSERTYAGELVDLRGLRALRQDMERIARREAKREHREKVGEPTANGEREAVRNA